MAWGATPGPRLVALVAESGLGKTRLVQELYRWLARSEDGGRGYWPPELATLDDNLQLNPDPAACDPTRPVPFLWWGIRLPDPGARNQVVAGQLSSALGALTPHLEPVLRTERRRQAGQGLALAVGNLALDFVSNALPAVGLLKTLGQSAVEIGQHARTLWRESEADAPAGIEVRQREDLIDRIVSDFSLLFSRDAAETPAVPAVVVLDDGQFSEYDPSIVTFVDRMMAAAVAGQWRVLFVVTYWTAEWNRHVEASDESRGHTVAGVVHQRCRDLDDGWAPLHLPAVEDLSPMVAAALPGLEPPQASALVERAGGNPRYLDEILRFCERNARLFVGRSTAGALTPQGIATLLERTVDLHALVEERLQLLEPEVRRAILLASAQGHDFLVPLVAEVGAILHDTTGEPEIARAAHPHAFVQRPQEGLGAFAQRVFHEVAVQQIGNEFDEQEVDEALREALRRRLDALDDLMHQEAPSRVRTCVLAARLLSDTGVSDDDGRVTMALVLMVQTYQAEHQHQLAEHVTERLVEHLSRTSAPGGASGYPYYVAAMTLLDAGRIAEARDVLDEGVARQRQLMAAQPGDGARDVLALLLGGASRGARAEGRLDEARGLAVEALTHRHALAEAGGGAEAMRDVFLAHVELGGIARDQGDLAAAEAAYEDASALAQSRDEALSTRQSVADLVLARVALADVVAAIGDIERAAGMYAWCLARLGPAAGPDSVPEDDDRRAGVLERLGRMARTRGDLDGAGRALAEAVEIRRRLAERLATPAARAGFANALRESGDVQWDRRDVSAACTAYSGSLAAIEAAGEPTPFMLRVRSLALERLGRVALVLDDLDAAAHIFARRLEVDEVVAAQGQTVAAWRDVVTSEFWLADIAEQRGEGDAAAAGYARALDLARELLARQDTPGARDDVARLEARLARLGVARHDDPPTH